MSELGEGPGDALKSAREALNVSEREVADALNLPLSVITAMEANDYEQLPPPVFTRGYLRSYARLLELDPDDIVASFPVPEEDNVTSLTAEVAVVSTPNPLADRRVQLIAAAVVAVVLLIIVIVSLSSSSDEVEAGSAADGRAAESAAAPAPPADQPRDSAVIAAEEAAAIPSEPTPASSERAVVPVVEPDSEPAEVATEVAQSAAERSAEAQSGPADNSVSETAEVITDPTPAGMRRITPFGDDVLTMTFSEDCWVDVKDRDGTRLYGDLIRGGRTIALIGDAPFSVLLGYAPGAQVSFNGVAMDVASQTRNNVARLTVGN